MLTAQLEVHKPDVSYACEYESRTRQSEQSTYSERHLFVVGLPLMSTGTIDVLDEDGISAIVLARQSS
jgi:hypothetical protein